MKKTSILVVFLLSVLLLAACGKFGTPSDEMIRTDIENSLYEKNEYAIVKNIETIKTLEEDGTYEITLKITAETKYADWTYEADMFYTKYDQGWMLDDVAWNSADYTQTRIPDTDTMVEYATSYLLSHEVYSDVSFTDYMTPMQNADLEVTATHPDILKLSWNGEESFRYAKQIYDFSALWQYDAGIDNWVLVPDDEHGSLGYHVEHSSGTLVPDEDIDLVGNWYAKGDSILVKQGWATGTIFITEFSETEVEARFPDLENLGYDIDPHFVRTNDIAIIYENKDGNRITFQFHETGIQIQFYLTEHTNPIAIAEVS